MAHAAWGQCETLEFHDVFLPRAWAPLQVFSEFCSDDDDKDKPPAVQASFRRAASAPSVPAAALAAPSDLPRAASSPGPGTGAASVEAVAARGSRKVKLKNARLTASSYPPSAPAPTSDVAPSVSESEAAEAMPASEAVAGVGDLDRASATFVSIADCLAAAPAASHCNGVALQATVPTDDVELRGSPRDEEPLEVVPGIAGAVGEDAEAAAETSGRDGGLHKSSNMPSSDGVDMGLVKSSKSKVKIRNQALRMPRNYAPDSSLRAEESTSPSGTSAVPAASVPPLLVAEEAPSPQESEETSSSCKAAEQERGAAVSSCAPAEPGTANTQVRQLVVGQESAVPSSSGEGAEQEPASRSAHACRRTRRALLAVASAQAGGELAISTCRRCVFDVSSAEGCRSRGDCDFCHLCPESVRPHANSAKAKRRLGAHCTRGRA